MATREKLFVSAPFKLIDVLAWVLRSALMISATLLGFQRSWSYPIARITNPRIDERRGRRGVVIRTIAFDCDGRSRRATPALSLSEAQSLLDGPFRDLSSR